jgi:hypothetical protein
MAVELRDRELLLALLPKHLFDKSWNVAIFAEGWYSESSQLSVRALYSLSYT